MRHDMRDTGARRVLIVDDSPAFTDALKRLLSAEGFVAGSEAVPKTRCPTGL